MKECKYYHEDGDRNKHHQEGDIWAHTLLAYDYGVSNGAPKIVLWALILHDLGRTYTRMQDDENRRVLFYDFEGVSCFVALEVLNKTDLSQEDKCYVLKLIAFQYTIIDYIKYNSPNQEELLKMFLYDEKTLYYLALYVECDLFGRKVAQSELKHYKLDKIKLFQQFSQKIKNKKLQKTEKPNNLFLLVGPPCSRKSTWLKNRNEIFLTVNRDSSIKFVGEKYNKHSFNEAYDFIEAKESRKKEVSTHYRHIEEFVKQSKNVDIVIDNPNLKLRHRKEWIDIFKTTHNIRVVLFLNSFKELQNCDNARYMTEGKTIGKEAILEKLIDFIYPLHSEGIDEISVVFNK